MFSHLWAAAPSPSRSPLAGSVVGAAVSTGGGWGLRGKGGAGGSSCLGRGPHIASMPRGGPSRSTSRESRCSAGPGASSPPFRVLVSTEAGNSQNDLPKVMAQILGTGGVSLGTQPGSLLQGPDEQRLVKEEAPAGLRGARGEGWRGSRELDVREAANPGPGLPREASFPFPLGEGSKQPQPRPSTEPPHKRQLRPLAPVAHASGKGSCIPCGVLGPTPLKAERRPAWGWGLERSEGEPSTCSVQRPQPKPGPQQPSRPRHGSVHTLAHAQQSHTCTHPPLRPSVEAHACELGEDLHGRSEAGASSGSWTTGLFPPPPPHLDNDIRK